MESNEWLCVVKELSVKCVDLVVFYNVLVCSFVLFGEVWCGLMGVDSCLVFV